MKENPEVALFMLCNPYNPVGETPIHNWKLMRVALGKGVRTRSNFGSLVVSIIVEACANFNVIYRVGLFCSVRG